jgi:hemerythrin superfamily protein
LEDEPMNAITRLKDDHKRVKELFRRYKGLGRGARKTKAKLVGEMIRELSEHAALEEMVFYPECRARIPDTTGIVLESLEEHHIVKWTLDELRKMDPSHERYDAKVTVLMENVGHHIREEEGDLFPEVSRRLSRRDLSEIGEAMQAFRNVAPTQPQPKAPDEPPDNLLAAVGAAPVDTVNDSIADALGAYRMP